MASITKLANGRKAIQFYDTDERRTRKSIRVGKMNMRQAEQVQRVVEELLACRRIGKYTLAGETIEWLADCDEQLYDRLHRAGLVPEREASESVPATPLLGSFIEDYIASREATHKQTTLDHYRRAKADLVAHFGEAREMGTVTKEEVKRFRLWYEGKGYARNTINKRMQRGKQFWQAAVDDELFERNPFDGQDCQVRPVEERFYYVEQGTIDKVLAEIPCPQWRLVVALARYAGLRVCELFAIEWEHVNWDKSRILIDSPKTGERWIPLFAEVLPYLLEVAEQRGDDPRVITRFPSRGNSNLRTQFERYCRLAAVDKWVKPFQNMRASCEVDLCRTYPQHVAARWLGHSENVAFEHYLRATDEDFDRAAGLAEKSAAKSGAVRARNGAKSGAVSAEL